MYQPVSACFAKAQPCALPVFKARLGPFASKRRRQARLPRALSRQRSPIVSASAGGSEENPFITNKRKQPADDDWPSAQEDQRQQQQSKASSLDLSLPTLGKEQPVKPRFAKFTTALSGLLVVLFFCQWWGFLTNFQHQTSFITNATRSRTGPGSFFPALKHLTFGIPEPGHWNDLTVKMMLDKGKVLQGEWWRFYSTTLVHANLLHLVANTVAIHEFGKELEVQVGWSSFIAVLVFAAYCSGLAVIATGRPVGYEALLPCGASGLVTGITGALVFMSLFLKNLRDQGSLGSSGAALVVAFLLGQSVPALDNMIHFGGLFGGLLAAIIILISHGIRGGFGRLFKGRSTKTVHS